MQLSAVARQAVLPQTLPQPSPPAPHACQRALPPAKHAVQPRQAPCNPTSHLTTECTVQLGRHDDAGGLLAYVRCGGQLQRGHTLQPRQAPCNKNTLSTTERTVQLGLHDELLGALAVHVLAGLRCGGHRGGQLRLGAPAWYNVLCSRPWRLSLKSWLPQAHVARAHSKGLSCM